VPVTPRAHEHCSSGSDFCFAMTMLWPRASFSLTFVDDGRATDRSCLFLPSAVVVSNSPEAACITHPTPYILNPIPSQGHAKAHGCQATALRRSHGGGPVLVQSFTPSHPKSGAKKILNPTTDFAGHSKGETCQAPDIQKSELIKTNTHRQMGVVHQESMSQARKPEDQIHQIELTAGCCIQETPSGVASGILFCSSLRSKVK